MPVINATGAVCRDITMNATLTISGTNSYPVCGNWNNSGLLTPGSGTVVFNSTRAQNIGGSANDRLQQPDNQCRLSINHG